MKVKNYVSLLLFFIFSFSYSQTIDDIIRVSSYYNDGTARFNAMGGAFSSLGGDLSAISINPASSSIFTYNEFGITIGLDDNTIENNLNGYLSKTENTSETFNQLGAVWVFTNGKSKFSFAYNLQNVYSYNDNFSFSGNNSSSIDKYFLYYADGVPSNDLLIYSDETTQSVYQFLGENYGFGDQQAFLGYQGYIINSFDDSNNTYQTNASYSQVNQDINIERLGDHYKHSFNFGGSYNNYLFFGVNLNYHGIEFQERKIFNESGYSNNSSLQGVEFNEYYNSFGNGFSIQFGSIMKIRNFRIGLSYQSPTWIDFEEENEQILDTKVRTDNEIKSYSIDPKTVNVYDKYRLRLPSRSTVGFSYIFAQRGLISFDYEITKYNNAMFPDNDDNYLNELNYIIDDRLYDTAQSIRLGGEYRIKNNSLRAGIFHYKGPENLNKNKISGFSFGYGINLGGSRFDISYVSQSLYSTNNLYPKGLTTSYSTDRSINNIIASYHFNF
ncbi:MAG: hypothetical protein VYE25_02330 [Bacteroidota bacterium]|nr:hypothetical protein [Bacteroidota bacterium]|tara:strand:+ start:722 stop:2215 length:1494 start_codon:yes stop_codon:yes gene_type:complete